MEQVGFVKKIDGNKMELEVRRVSACGTSCNTCSSGCEVKPHTITVYNELNAKIGDFVEIKGESKRIVKYALIVYMIPFVAFILGVVAGNAIFKSLAYANYELLSFFTGFITMAISFLIVRVIDKKVSKKADSSIRIVRIL